MVTPIKKINELEAQKESDDGFLKISKNPKNIRNGSQRIDQMSQSSFNKKSISEKVKS